MSALIKKAAVTDRSVIELRDTQGTKITVFKIIERVRPEGGQIDLLTEKLWHQGANSQLHTIHHVQDLDDLILALTTLRETYQ